MSILDDEDVFLDNMDKIMKNMTANKRRDNLRYTYIDEASLDDKEYENYCTYLSKVDAFYRPLIPGLPCFPMLRQSIKVVFSKEKPTYDTRYRDKKWFKEDRMVLGEYFPKHKTYSECIYLYIENIKEACKLRPDDKFSPLLLSTYVHELYHAYFRSGDRYMPEVEEPLAEFGALFCMEAMAFMGLITLNEVHMYHSRVNDKIESIPIYAFGGYIFEKYLSNYLSWNMGLLLEAYRLNIHNSFHQLPEITSWNSRQWDNVYKELCKALNYVD